MSDCTTLFDFIAENPNRYISVPSDYNCSEGSFSDRLRMPLLAALIVNSPSNDVDDKTKYKLINAIVTHPNFDLTKIEYQDGERKGRMCCQGDYELHQPDLPSVLGTVLKHGNDDAYYAVLSKGGRLLESEMSCLCRVLGMSFIEVQTIRGKYTPHPFSTYGLAPKAAKLVERENKENECWAAYRLSVLDPETSKLVDACRFVLDIPPERWTDLLTKMLIKKNPFTQEQQRMIFEGCLRAPAENAPIFSLAYDTGLFPLSGKTYEAAKNIFSGDEWQKFRQTFLKKAPQDLAGNIIKKEEGWLKSLFLTVTRHKLSPSRP